MTIRREDCRILVADDNADAAGSLAMLLGTYGLPVQTSLRGDEALLLMTSYRPEIAFIDIGMPGVDGYRFAARLRSNGDATLLVALTGWGGSHDIERAFASGFDVHLVKPADPLDILVVIGAHCRGAGRSEISRRLQARDARKQGSIGRLGPGLAL